MNLAQKLVNKQMEADRKEIAKAIGLSLITDEVASKAFEGFKKMHSMSPDEMEKLAEQDIEDIIKYYADDDVRAVVATIQDKFNIVKDAMQRRLKQSRAYTGFVQRTLAEAKKKNISEEYMVNHVLELDNVVDINNLAGIDTGWMQAFRTVQAPDSLKIRIRNFADIFRFVQVSGPTARPEFGAIGAPTDDEFGPKYFAVGNDFADRIARFNAIDINTVINAYGRGAVEVAAVGGYRIIAEKNSNVKEITARDLYNNETKQLDKDIELAFEIRSQLNHADFELSNIANNTKKYKRSGDHVSEGSLGVSPNDIKIFYVNAQWREKMMTAMEVGVYQNVNRAITEKPAPLLPNIAVVSSFLLPKCGAHTISNATSTTTTDDYGFYGTVSEVEPGDHLGGMLVIPGKFNIHGMFRPFTLKTMVNDFDDKTSIMAKVEQNWVMNTKQKAYVKIRANVTGL